MSLTLATFMMLASVPPAASDVPRTKEDRSRQERKLRAQTAGLGFAAAFFGVTYGSLKLTGTLVDVQRARELERSGDDVACLMTCYEGVYFNLAATPFLATSAAFLGGAMHVHGRRLAREGRGLGRSRRHGVILTSVGAGTLGVAAVAFGLGVGLQWMPSTPSGLVAVREAGWWTGSALGFTGAAFAGLGHGVLREHRADSRKIDVMAVPMVGPGLSGFSLAGRF